MPLYDYRCSACHRTFEALLDRWDSQAPACPHCGAGRPVRQMSVFAVASFPAGDAPACGDGGCCGPGGCGCRASSN